jgi:hypothetical protein
VDLKHLLKRGALLAAANWPTVAIQFVAQTTFQVLLAVPIIGAAILVAVLLGGDLADLLQGGLREIFTTIASALLSEPLALGAFITAFAFTLLGGSVLMFAVKGGTVDVILTANASAGPIEREPITLEMFRSASRFTLQRFTTGCARLFRPYLSLGFTLMFVYAVSVGAYLAFVVYGYRVAEGRALIIGWTVIAALAAALLVAWITLVNLLYLLMQIAMAVEGVGLVDGCRAVVRFVRAEFRDLALVFLVVLALAVAAILASALAWSGVGLVDGCRAVVRFVRAEFRDLALVFLVVLALAVAAILASALAWSGVGLIAFVPLVGLAVFPLQLAALVLRGLVFEYLGLTALGAYVTLYQRHASKRAEAFGRSSVGSPVEDPA